MGWRKFAESFNLKNKDIDIPELKRFKTKNKVELPNNAKFDGDLLPSDGDSSKAELSAWKEGYKLFKKDKKREDKGQLHGSPLTSEEGKRCDIEEHSEKNDLYSSLVGGKLSWFDVLADVSVDKKPDGSIKILVDESVPVQPQVQQEVTPQEQQQVEASATKVKSWIIKQAGKLSLVGKECATHCGVSILDDSKELEFYKVAKGNHKWNEVIPQGVWESKFDSLVK